jgi:GT2 family glycosyltransferase
MGSNDFAEQVARSNIPIKALPEATPVPQVPGERSTFPGTPAHEAEHQTIRLSPLPIEARGRGGIAASAQPRPAVQGKFIHVNGKKFYIRGVTYGTFRPNEKGEEFPSPVIVERDFAQMAANGINSVRTYTPPPLWLLDAARRHGLYVMVGLPAERSAAFVDYRQCARELEEMVRTQVRACNRHPAILCYTIGNEIPASVVRWHGAREIERHLKRLYLAAKKEDPAGLVTYVNYPSTEYLNLPFLDFVCFNVYLESKKRLDAYLARLHHGAGDRPLVMAEIGLDSLRHGERSQARVLDWQVRTAFAAGCAGVFVYAWTDEWFRGGAEVHDWKFGLTDRERNPKFALAAVREAFTDAPFRMDIPWPRISIIICSYNGARTLRESCEAVLKLRYPKYEVIVVDDGSTDQTPSIGRECGFRVISTPNHGLSHARNVGMEAATGEIIVYLDDDAYPNEDWLIYIGAFFQNPANAHFGAVGGPNIAPLYDGPIAHCVAHAPGGPSHVLLTHRKAEHIPGCNMALRKAALKAIGGFDPQFRVAGDDVDVCWRLQEAGWNLGFCPAAMVWHHRRNSIRTYWKQQVGYGKAEAMLERKWPQKFNAVGHMIWSGRLYAAGVNELTLRSGKIYHGRWGLAPFQSLYKPAPNLFEWLPLMPEWYLIIGVLAVLGGVGLLWLPLWKAWSLLELLLLASIIQSVRCAEKVPNAEVARSGLDRWKFCAITAFLHLLQPLARLCGRLRHGLTFWRSKGSSGYALPRPWHANIWTKRGMTVEERLEAMEEFLRAQGAIARHGGDYDRWDFEVRGGLFGSARLFLGLDNHGSGCQLLRVRSWPVCSWTGVLLAVCLAGLAFMAGYGHAWGGCAVLVATALLVSGRTVQECAASTGAFLAAVRKIEREEKIPDPRLLSS